jgi:PIN domain nuclease of toxin-antitoxin system
MATGEESELSAAAKRSFQADELFVSIVSYWEIAIKRSIGKLRWDDRETEAFARGLHENQIREIPIRRSHCDRVAALPWHHRDPFDRMLIAQATMEEFAVLTADRRFGKYKVNVVW